MLFSSAHPNSLQSDLSGFLNSGWVFLVWDFLRPLRSSLILITEKFKVWVTSKLYLVRVSDWSLHRGQREPFHLCCPQNTMHTLCSLSLFHMYTKGSLQNQIKSFSTSVCAYMQRTLDVFTEAGGSSDCLSEWEVARWEEIFSVLVTTNPLPSPGSVGLFWHQVTLRQVLRSLHLSSWKNSCPQHINITFILHPLLFVFFCLCTSQQCAHSLLCMLLQRFSSGI